MGIFGSILKAVPVIGNVIGAGQSKKAVKQANAATQAAIQQAQGTLNQQYQQSSDDLNPWVDTGHSANTALSGLLGLNGNDAQASAISEIQASPLYQSLYSNGLDTVLNNASATGGLRGGNAQRSLYSLGRDTLAQVIQQQLANYGGVSSLGLGAAGTRADLGGKNASALADLTVGSGRSNAGAINDTNTIDNRLFGSLRSTVQNLIPGLDGSGGGGISSFFGSGGGLDLGKLGSTFGLGGGKSSIFGAYDTPPYAPTQGLSF